ncbi:MAG: YigZ family protein [Bacteroidetes bacterium]|nr:YigZ family protein [Bacteroidota bacterium]
MLFEDTYKTISKESEGLFKDRGSKFIAKAYPVQTETQVKGYLESLRKEYHDARHHCYAYQLGFDKSTYRTNDDGEPSGTAGRPIFGQISSFDLTNVLIVVIRYFGGAKLGVSGLINAYKTASKEAILSTKIIIKTINYVYQIDYQYTEMNEVMKILKEYKLKPSQKRFDSECNLEFRVRKGESTTVYEKMSQVNNLNIKFLRTI